MRARQLAEQVVREVLANRPDILLDDVVLVELSTGPVVVVAIRMPRSPTPEQVAEVERAMQERVGDPSLRLVVRTVEAVDATAKGRILLGAAHLGVPSSQATEAGKRIEEAARAALTRGGDVLVTAIDALRDGEGWTVNVEAAGPAVPSPADVRRIEAEVARTAGTPVDLSVRARTDLVVTSERYLTLDAARQ